MTTQEKSKVPRSRGSSKEVAKPFLAGNSSACRVFHHQEACVLFEDRFVSSNRRRPHPPLAWSICCLMCSSFALFVSTTEGEAALANAVPVILGPASGFPLVWAWP